MSEGERNVRADAIRSKREMIEARTSRLLVRIRRLSVLEASGLIAILEEHCPDLVRMDEDQGNSRLIG